MERITISICILDRAKLPLTDKSYYDHVAELSLAPKGMRFTMTDGDHYDGTTQPLSTEDRDGKLFLTVEVPLVLADRWTAGEKPVDMKFIEPCAVVRSADS